MGEIDKIEQVESLVLDFLRGGKDRSVESMDQLKSEHPELMPELGERLDRAQRIQAAVPAAERGEAAEAEVETLPFDSSPRYPASAARALNVRCPYCFSNILVGAESDLSSITCETCRSDFGLAEDIRREGTWHVGRFEIVEHLGAGSFGSVWKARDVELDRFVAIKIPRQGKLEPREVQQFVREARVAAQLNHPGIVEVLEVGRHEDSVYIVSDFIDGSPLTQKIEEHGLPCREAAELCVKIAEALEHAHDAGVIHRDLKPANIMLDRDGRPFVTDFGLAKHRIGEVTITADGHILGTPAYMSPEQARGNARQADRRSDVYSLGTIMFELLTGERPFRGDISRLMHQVAEVEAPRPRELRRSVPRDLETICLKCLEKEPDRRYSTANALRDDLMRWLNDQPIRARPIGSIERARRWCVKHPLLSLLVANSILTLVLVAIAGFSISNTRERGLEVALAELDAYSQRDSTEMRLLRELTMQVADEVTATKLNLSNRDAMNRFVRRTYERLDQLAEFRSHPFASWYLLDTDGKMLAVWPEDHQVSGHVFSSRDYFRGALASPGQVYTSRPFLSENDRLYKFALSIALTDAAGKPTAVLAGSVATDSTRAIAREEKLLRSILWWTGVVLVPAAGLSCVMLASFIYRRIR